MRAPAPPLTFLALVIGGWVCVRAAILMPDGSTEIAPFPVLAAAPNSSATSLAGTVQPIPLQPLPPVHLSGQARPSTSLGTNEAVDVAVATLASAPFSAFGSAVAGQAEPGTTPAAPAFPPILGAAPERPSRWSGSAWLYHRRGGGSSLAAGGMLGGSQAGARLTYRLNDDIQRPLSLSVRLYSPLDSARAAEAALGVEWKPSAHAPVRILAERRQAIGEDGRSAFSLMAYGGVSDQSIGGPFRLEAYAQAGVVGLKARDLFADGAVAVGVPLDEKRRLTVSAAAWGAAQPGVSRVDVGPQVSVRLPVEDASVRISAEWRFRVAGDAAPSSGPAITVSAGF